MKCLDKPRTLSTMGKITLVLVMLCVMTCALLWAIERKHKPVADPDWRAMRERARQIEAVRAKEKP